MSEENDYPKGEEQRYEGDGPNLRYDDFVGRIVQDPNETPRVTLLSGYLGSSSEEGHVRLYLDEELSRYVEIPEKAILHAQELSPEQSPLGGSLVWIDSGAEVVHGPVGSKRRKANFLEGQIAQDYIGGYDREGGGETTTQTRECGGGGGLRPTEIGPACGQSQAGPCIPPTEQVYCHTQTGIFCTRFGPGCRRTLFEPACTLSGPNCRTAVFQQCHSVHYPCVTQNQTYCAASGYRGCAPLDFTIWQEQFDPQADFGGGGRAAIPPTRFCPSAVDACPTRFNCPSQHVPCQSVLVQCPSQVDACPTRFNCPSRYTPCQSQLVRCPSALDACPTRFNCPSVAAPCVTQDFSCETRGRCPSAVDACPTRFGCFQTQICVSQVCQQSQACFPQGGGGGFDPGGGFGGGF